MKNIEWYRDLVKPLLTDKRYIHTLAVEKMAISLAEKYGADPKKAAVAAVLHDSQKCVSYDEMLALIRENPSYAKIENENKALWHAVAGAVFARKIAEISDDEIIAAIRYHTSGRKNMSLLEKIVFVADAISEDRDYDGVDGARAAEQKSLEECIVFMQSFEISRLSSKKKTICLDSVDCYNDCLKKIAEKKENV